MRGKLTSEISQEEFAQIKMFAESNGFTTYINPTGNPKFSKLGNYGEIVVCYCHVFQTIDINAPREQKEASVRWEFEKETSARSFEDLKEFSNDLANAVIIAGMLKNTKGVINITEPKANDFLTHIIANETNKNHPGLNITPDDPRVQEHVKKLERVFGAMLKGKQEGLK